MAAGFLAMTRTPLLGMAKQSDHLMSRFRALVEPQSEVNHLDYDGFT